MANANFPPARGEGNDAQWEFLILPVFKKIRELKVKTLIIREVEPYQVAVSIVDYPIPEFEDERQAIP